MRKQNCREQPASGPRVRTESRKGRETQVPELLPSRCDGQLPRPANLSAGSHPSLSSQGL